MKKILSLLLSTILIFSNAAFAFAEEKVDFSKTENGLRNELELAGFDVVSIEKSNDNMMRSFAENDTLYFETVEEFVSFVEELEEFNNSSDNIDIVNQDNNQILSRGKSSTVNGVGKISKYRPFLAGNGILCWKNITFDFKAEWYPLAGYYTLVENSVRNINSNLSGLGGVKWYQTNGVANYNDSTALTTDITVAGYYHFGVKIGEFDVGATHNSSWTFTSKDINKYL